MNTHRIHFQFAHLFLGAALGLIGQSASAQSAAVAVAAEIGITPQVVVIANLNVASATTVLSNLAGATTLRQQLNAKHQEVDAASATVTEFAELLLNDPANEATQQQCEAAIAVLTTSKVQVMELRETLFEVAVASLPQETVAMIVGCSAAAPYRIQAEFRATQRTHDEWKFVERALRSERQALRDESDLDETYAAILSNLRSDVKVVEAAIHLQMNLEAMEQSFAQYE